MIDIHRLSGRMGNEMFRDAFIYAQMRDGVVPDVYLQDPKYFDKYRDDIKKRYGEGVGYMPYVGVHLRVGGNPIDPNEPRYMENPFYTNLANTGYYLKAMEMFPENEQWKFLVFSDDMDFARAYFTGGKFGFDDSETDIESFNKFASCHHKILANSSWSWWAGYMSNMPDAKIIAPSEKSWFADGQVRAKLLSEWTAIDP